MRWEDALKIGIVVALFLIVVNTTLRGTINVPTGLNSETQWEERVGHWIQTEKDYSVCNKQRADYRKEIQIMKDVGGCKTDGTIIFISFMFSMSSMLLVAIVYWEKQSCKQEVELLKTKLKAKKRGK